MKNCLYVEPMGNGCFYGMIQLRSGMLVKAGPVFVDAEHMYRFAMDNGYTDIIIVAGYIHLGGAKE